MKVEAKTLSFTDPASTATVAEESLIVILKEHLTPNIAFRATVLKNGSYGNSSFSYNDQGIRFLVLLLNHIKLI